MIKDTLRRARSQFRQAALDAMCKQLMTVSSGGRTPFDYRELKKLREALLSQNLCCIDGQMVREFDSVVFSAPLNEVKGPVKTQFGFHLLEVTGRTA